MVVGFVESIHAVRAVEPMLRLDWDVHVVASHPHWPHAAWRDVTLHVDPGFEPNEPGPGVTVRHLKPAAGDSEPVVEGLSWRQRPGAVAELIAELKPDLIDSMEIQHGGYVTLEAREWLREPPPWVVHNWGSDIYYFGRNPRYVSRLKAVLGSCDYYGAECHRDIGLARAFGFSGRVLPVLPSAGGFDLDRLRGLRSEGSSSKRRVIALKATDSFVYRPDTALDALERCSDHLGGYRLALYTASDSTIERARGIAEGAGMEVEVVSTAAAPVCHDEILAMHGRARVSISLAESDAICTSFLEAIVMGSFPIQSNTGCAQGWAEHGHSAMFVSPSDPDEVAVAIRCALTDDDLVDRAAGANAATATARLDREVVLAKAMEGYERIAADLTGGSPWKDFETEADDPGWVSERRAEIERAEQVGWARGEVALEDRIDDWYDNELVQRDAHIESLRRHIGALQQSLDGFHRELEAAASQPSLHVRLARRLTPRRLRAWARRRAPALMSRMTGHAGEGD